MATFKKGQRLTCKGDIKEKLAAADIEPDKLVPYQHTYEAGELDIQSELESIASKVLAVATSEYPAEVIDLPTINGAGYCDNYYSNIIASMEAIAYGTAVQGRAYKDTVVANNPKATADVFVATPKGGGVAKKADDGADALAAAMANLG